LSAGRVATGLQAVFSVNKKPISKSIIIDLLCSHLFLPERLMVTGF